LRTGRPGLLVEGDVRESAALAEAAGADRQVAYTLRMQIAATARDLGLPAVAVEQWSLIMLNAPTAAERARAALLASVAALEIGDRPRASALFADCRVADLSDPVLQIRRAAHESELPGDSTAVAEKPMRGATTLADRIAAAAGGVVHLAPEARHAYLAAHQAAYFSSCETTVRPACSGRPSRCPQRRARSSTASARACTALHPCESWSDTPRPRAHAGPSGWPPYVDRSPLAFTEDSERGPPGRRVLIAGSHRDAGQFSAAV
jgi:hypothetical protein